MSTHFNRRNIMSAAGGLAAAASSFGKSAKAAKTGPTDLEPRGYTGKLERLPNLDLESNDEMLTAIRVFINGELTQAAMKSAQARAKAAGITAKDNVSRERAFELLQDDPIVQMRTHTWQHLQMLMWDNLKREFHGNYDAYMSEMEAADKVGPGKLELNPGIEPEYTTHEIHMQPGGYTGDPFAGHIYHYGTNNFYNGGNYQDELHMKMAAAVPVPKDGKVLRILDQGCSCGQLTVALKQRFPDAEVWGIDIGAPMVRYAHMRANDLGVAANFRHALAEDCKFPDGHFDIVTSYILHHEVTKEASEQIVKEAHRVLRPGGIYYPIDFNTNGTQMIGGPSAYGKLREWITYRWNHERWLLDYNAFDQPGEMKKVGFEVHNGPNTGLDSYNSGYAGANIVGVKKA